MASDGGPAFPCEYNMSTEYGSCHPVNKYGLTLLDWFAGQVEVPSDLGWVAPALMGSLPPKWTSESDFDWSIECSQWWSDARARFRYAEAEAMLAERERRMKGADDATA